ncbi:MAG TPA: SMP-30/gluconolactonase/LRE family protein [Acetobacteraceae bacterium]|nr:SMP-30/gluconolactonase/LRE family protein [Acetobacteraceae bacterium]
MADVVTRRAAIMGGAALIPSVAFGQNVRPQLATPPSVISNPPRQWGRYAPPDIYPDPDILVIDNSFKRYVVGLAGIHRLWTGFQWAEGPAWSGEGQYVVFSDVKGDTQYRYIWESGRVTTYRKPSYNSNGNSFDFQGRQLSTQDFFRRVVRWEPDGSMTVLAAAFDGKPLNSPNDLVPHPDGSIWFTDPPYGGQLSEGHPDVKGGRTNPDGVYNPNLGDDGVGLIGGVRQVLPTNTYRLDPKGGLEVVVPGSEVPDPNGLCFSPDYRTLYVISTGPGPGETTGGKGVVWAFDVQGSKLGPKRLFTDCMVDGVHCGPDGMRADRAGNLWIGSNAPLGYAGVTVWNPAGKLLGRIRLPEVCANLCFAGPKRDFLFMTASQSIYMVRVNIQGAAPG